MKITKIELLNFRNYKKIVFDNLEQLNIIIGDNGVGKTSILEAIYFCSIAKSFKSSNDLVLINNEFSHSKVKISIFDTNTKKLEIDLSELGKVTKINSVKKRKLSDFIFKYNVVLYSPDEIRLIKDSPVVRRNYFNIFLSQTNKYYLKLLNDYNKLIKLKNDYLKKTVNINDLYLDVLDSQLSVLGAQISDLRYKYIQKLNKYLKKNYKIFNKKSSFSIEYKSDFLFKTSDEIVTLLKSRRKKEIVLKNSSTGIHRDDYIFLYDGKVAKDFCSQGIQKSLILTLKFSEIDLLIEEYNIYPILLLDDLFSELDLTNRKKILRKINDKIQVFITTTDVNLIDKKLLTNAKVLKITGNGDVEDGRK